MYYPHPKFINFYAAGDIMWANYRLIIAGVADVVVTVMLIELSFRFGIISGVDGLFLVGPFFAFFFGGFVTYVVAGDDNIIPIVGGWLTLSYMLIVSSQTLFFSLMLAPIVSSVIVETVAQYLGFKYSKKIIGRRWVPARNLYPST